MTDQELAQKLTDMAVRSMPPASDILSEAAYRLTQPDDTASKIDEILLRVRRLTPDRPTSLQGQASHDPCCNCPACAQEAW